ncbi:inactive peptidyl-prolyl cis-trans isomerase FKBP6 [Stegostoma tigrinum]|uniref:inactive peptidyl-prolyl cis-trans isomerase FKBP6 n=1 Tax=Stegostoma tigrinum TaxID=3053191 RepID=UPI00202AC6ED|nr:inactive peptidyl-prolyl cis-trans isomerase FKBP6 [Stegostoma tigrinum]
MNGPPPSPHGHLSPFYYMSQRMQDVTGDGGVLKEILRPGSGSVIPSTASVSVHYSAYSEYTDKPFDSNVQRDVPRFMKLGRDITLLGMELAIQTMRKGEFARFLFKPQYAYGQLGCPPRIPANATVMFELEILHFVDTLESDEYFMLSQEEQITYPVEKLLKVASTEREFGNYFFQLRRYEDAKDQYKKALSVFAHRRETDEQMQEIHSSKLLLYLNLSLVSLKLNVPRRALVYGERALGIESKNPKALFRCGQACILLLEYDKAKDFLLRAQKLEPFNPDVNCALVKLDRCYREWGLKEKEMCSRMFAAWEPAAVKD